jgi:hypothetical protein
MTPIISAILRPECLQNEIANINHLKYPRSPPAKSKTRTLKHQPEYSRYTHTSSYSDPLLSKYLSGDNSTPVGVHGKLIKLWIGGDEMLAHDQHSRVPGVHGDQDSVLPSEDEELHGLRGERIGEL